VTHPSVCEHPYRYGSYHESVVCHDGVMLVSVALLAVQLHVILPDAKNLQNLSFWVAQGAGYFRDEGLDLVLDVPETPGEVVERLARPDAQVAVLPPPVYLDLIAQRKPFRLVANLLRNDPMNIVVRRSVVAARGIRLDAPVAERLRALRGVRIAVPPGPASRFAALVRSAGLDPAKDFQAVTMTGDEENEGLATGRVDALFAHTPFLERALADQDAVMVVNQSAGELPQVAFRQIHALVVSADFAQQKPELVRKLVRAIARAETLIHRDRKATVEAVMKALPAQSRRHLETLVPIYEPAVPATPEVSADALAPALALYPATKLPPKLDGIDLRTYVLPRFARDAAHR
jgi:ABC-type nitrate/sulfonate/bicarbonate transport system substrate-binding protein